MRFLHVLLAITLTLGRVRARLEQAMVQGRHSRVLVVDVTLTLLLCRPAIFMVLALVDGAFVRPVVRLDVLGQITRSLELLVTLRAFMDLRLSVLLAPCHGAKRLVIIELSVHVALGSGGWSHFLGRNHATRRKRDNLAVFVTYKLGLLPIVAQPPVE